MLIAAAVVPAPPLLVPDVATGAASELDDVRAAIGDALRQLQAAAPDLLICVGSAEDTSSYPSGSRGTLRGFGVDVDVALGGGDVASDGLPTSLTVLAWLLADHGWTGRVEGQSIATDVDPSQALKLGQSIAEGEPRVAMLVAGDGSAALTEKSPGYVVNGAVEWQQKASQALAAADVHSLWTLTADDGARYFAAGRGSWQVLVGAANGGGWRGHRVLSVAPYGVAYDVVTWEPAAR